jgi:hypothetical protein
MLRRIATALAEARRFDPASMTGSLASRHDGIGSRSFWSRRLAGLAPEHPRDGHGAALTSLFPAPWRIVEIPNGFVVSDAAGQQLSVFYGRSDPNTAGHRGCLTMDEARLLATDFAKLPELLKGNSESQ